jgi:MAC/Perforin domain
MPDPLVSCDFVGRCYDVLAVDPLDIELGSRLMAVQFDKFVDTGDKTAQYPACMDYGPLSGGSYASVATEISSTFDFHSFSQQAGSLTVSDPTGALFSATVSASFTDTRDTTQSHTAMSTYTNATVHSYWLRLHDDGFKLDPELTAAVGALPATDNGSGAYAQFIKKFGTHYATYAMLGGMMHQRITIDSADYSSFLEDGLSVSAEATATFDVAAGKASASGQKTISQKFAAATKSTTEGIVYAGGDQTGTYDNWSSWVKDKPAPIKIELAPLYGLLTTAHFPTDKDIQKKQQLLKTAIETYLTRNGENVSNEVMHYGDEVVIALGSNGAPRYLSSDQQQFTHTTGSSDPNDPGRDTSLRWTLVNAADPAATGEVKAGDLVALKCSDGTYLDAEAGHDDSYMVGDGLTAPTGKGLSAAATQWKVLLAAPRPRTEIVDGDLVRFQSQWQDPDQQLGYLLGEPDANDAAQRVYAFGKKTPPGASIWGLSRQKPS